MKITVTRSMQAAKTAIEQLPSSAHPMDVMRTGVRIDAEIELSIGSMNDSTGRGIFPQRSWKGELGEPGYYSFCSNLDDIQGDSARPLCR